MRVWIIVAALLLAACAATSDDAATTTSNAVPSTGTPTTTTTPVTSTEATVSSTTPTTSASQDPRVEGWRSDIALLEERLLDLHPNPFWRTDAGEFAADLHELSDAVPEMTDEDIALELIRLMARIDGHTAVFTDQPALEYQLAQIALYEFEDGVFVVGSADPSLVGGRLISVNGTPPTDALAAVSAFVSYDNEQTIRKLAPSYLSMPEILVGAGLIERGDQVEYEIETPHEGVVVATPELIDPERWQESGGFPLPPRLGLAREQHADETIWWERVEESDALYIQYNFVAPLGDVVDELRAAVAQSPVGKIIVDLRRNPGGNNTTFGDLLEFLTEQDRAGTTLVVITGRHTFSAAANFATFLDVDTDTVFVGEGMGGSPNLYGDTRPLTLPFSGIEARISGRYWEIGGPGDTRETIPPDIEVEMSSAQYFEGDDPVLGAALDYE